MIVTDSQQNRHEKEIIQAIEKSMPNGIHVQGLVKQHGLSPTTLTKYLPVLENEYKIIHHEKIKNKHIYRINLYDEPTFDEFQLMTSQSFTKFLSAIYRAIDGSRSFGIAEKIEVYHHMVTMLAFLRYGHQLAIDNLSRNGQEIPDDITQSIHEFDNISKIVNLTMSPLIHRFYVSRLDHAVSESLEFLNEVGNTRKVKPSKFIKDILDEMKRTNPVVFAKVNEIDSMFKDTNKSNKSKSLN